MVSDLNIVTGDLEALSTDVSNVATEISGVSVTTDMADAPLGDARILIRRLDHVSGQRHRGAAQFRPDVLRGLQR